MNEGIQVNYNILFVAETEDAKAYKSFTCSHLIVACNTADHPHNTSLILLGDRDDSLLI